MNGRSSLAFATVVTIRSCSISARDRLRIRARREAAFRPRVRPATRCRMVVTQVGWASPTVCRWWAVPTLRDRSAADRRGQLHAQAQAPLLQLLLHFLQRRLAE